MRFSARRENKDIGPVFVDTSKDLGRGATAIIYKASFDGETYAAKIYNAGKRDNSSKVEAMLSNPPSSVSIQFAGTTYPQLAWPTALLKSEDGEAAGYLMPLVDLEESFPLDYYYDQALFKKLNAPDEVALSYKLEIARNLASIVADLHRHGHYFIDLKPQNIRVFRRTHIVTLVDCDGFSIKSQSGDRFPAELISTDYISPEAFRNQTAPKDLSEDQDRYALAVILFQLLNQGTHPFQGILQDEDGPNTNDEKAAAGLYPHGLMTNPKILPRPQSTHMLWADETRELFDKAFVGRTLDRPSATEWANHFARLLTEKALVRCDKEPLNLAHMRFKNKECPTCYLHDLPNLTVATISNNPPSTSTKPIANQLEANQDDIKVAWVVLAVILAIFITIFLSKNESPAELNQSSTDYLTPADNQKGQGDQPSEEAINLVTEGWALMTPWGSKTEEEYKKAYELNQKAFNLGHPEGASNIGNLYEFGFGVESDPAKAIEWYETAIAAGPFHSAQAELGIARILLSQVPNRESLNKASLMLSKARESINHNWWRERSYVYLDEAKRLEWQLREMEKALTSTDKVQVEPKEDLPPYGYGAVYFDPKSTVFGWALGYQTQKQANTSAKNSCRDRGALGECKKLTSGDSRCLAVAIGSGFISAASGNSTEESEKKAMESCSEIAQDCSIPIEGSGCSSW